MSKSHNKKRNTGLLYEFLVQSISRSLIEGDEKKSSRALKIIKRHFRPGTELYNEFKLISSLVKTTVSSSATAASIIQEAKAAARRGSVKELDRQKSLLIHEINHVINDDNFYDQHVNDYRILATVQTLVNDWRSTNVDLSRLASYEDQLMQHLTTSKASEPGSSMVESSPGTNRLLMKVMMKKLNEKYSNLLNDEQKSLVRAYAFSTASDDSTSIKHKLAEIKQNLLSAISDYESGNVENKYICDKLVEAKDQLASETFESIDDDTVTRFMLYTKLANELRTED